ncbi:MAG TPA: hypothetical protein VGI11_15305 [Variovorax sp.]
MTPLDILYHLLNFVAPAFAVGFLLPVLARVAMRRGAGAPAWWVQGAVNFVLGVVVLAGGLVVFGQDGRMATYAALVVVCAGSQWLLGGAWKA